MLLTLTVEWLTAFKAATLAERATADSAAERPSQTTRPEAFSQPRLLYQVDGKTNDGGAHRFVGGDLVIGGIRHKRRALARRTQHGVAIHGNRQGISRHADGFQRRGILLGGIVFISGLVPVLYIYHIRKKNKDEDSNEI